jgi:hypothetical protein
VSEEMVDLLDEVIDAAVTVVPNQREKTIDGFFQKIFRVRSKR